MGIVHRGVGLSAIVAACCFAACSTGGPDDQKTGLPGSAQGVVSTESAHLGKVGMHLNIGGTADTLDALSFTLSNGANSFNGTLTITDDAGNSAQSIELVIGTVPAGTGYVVSLYGADSQGDPCSGTSAPFTVTAGATTDVMVIVTCTVPTDAALPQPVDTGTVAIEAGITLTSQPPFGCPAISGVSISPAELLPPETAALGAVVTPGSGGSPTLLWSATCGSGTPVITNPTQPNATFSCGTAIGTTCTLTLALGLNGTGADGGSVGPVCGGVANTTLSETIACEAQCTTAADCHSTTACLVPSCTAGMCSFATPAAQGTACTDSGGSICDGAGTCVVPSFDVVRVGSGTGALSNTVTAPAFIDRFSLTGALLGTVALPSTGTQSLTFAGDTAEGDLTTSANGKLLVVAGHNYAAGTTVSGSSTTLPIAAFVGPGASPTIATMPVTGAFANGGSVRSAVSIDGTQVWIVGTSTTAASAGLWYGPTNVQLLQTAANKLGRCLRVAGSPSQLYGDSNFNPPGLFTIGSTPPPTSGTTTVSELNGLAAAFDASPFGFVLLSVGGVPTLYAADDSTGGTGGISKWTFSAGTWTKVWAVMGVGPQTDGGTTPMGYRGLAGYLTGSTVTLMASTGMAALMQDSLVVIVDTGLAAGPASQTVVATAAANTDFRGVAVPPHP